MGQKTHPTGFRLGGVLDWHSQWFANNGKNYALLLNEDGTFTDRGQQVINKTPFKRFGEQEEIYGTIHYLISDAASFVTGTVAAVDGGFSCFCGV